MIFSQIDLPSMTLIKSLTTGSSTETVEKSSLRSLCCRVEPASASGRRVNVTALSVTLYLFFILLTCYLGSHSIGVCETRLN